MKKRIAVIGTVGLPASYGGFETMVENLIKELGDDFNFTVYCSSLKYKEKQDFFLGASLVHIPLRANGKWSIFYDFFSILHSLFYADVLVILGVSGAFTIPLAKRLTNKKVITNIDGLEWRRDKWNRFAKRFLKMQEKIAVKYSDIVIADNKQIQSYIKERYLKPSEMIPYGGNHAKYRKLALETKKTYSMPEKYAFSVCRIEPENNIHMILNALSRVNYHMIFIGNWKSSEYGKELYKKYGNHSNLILLNPIYEQELLDEIRSNCQIYIHGHSAGGTNPSLVEAMNLGLPIVAYDVIYNRNTMSNAGYFFKCSEELENILNKINSIDLYAMGEKMKTEARKRYTWQIVATKYKSVFNK